MLGCIDKHGKMQFSLEFQKYSVKIIYAIID